MLNKIKILLMILTYGLNLFHDFQIHDHHHSSESFCVNQESSVHDHDNNAICQHKDKDGQELPFLYCRINHSVIYTRYFKTQATESSYNNLFIHGNAIKFDNYEFKSVNWINQNSSFNFHNFSGFSAGLRAPPTLSQS